MNKCGWALAEYHRKLEEGEQVWQELERVSKDIQWHEWIKESRGSMQARDAKKLVRELGDTPEYLQGADISGRKWLAVTTTFRLGNEARGYRYWMKEKERKFRLCEESEETLEETLEHIFEKCKITADDKEKWEKVRNGERKNLGKLLTIGVKWKREEKLKERG